MPQLRRTERRPIRLVLEVRENRSCRGRTTAQAAGVMVVLSLLAARVGDPFAGGAGWAVRPLRLICVQGFYLLFEQINERGVWQVRGSTARAGPGTDSVAGVCVPGVFAPFWRTSMDLGKESESPFS